MEALTFRAFGDALTLGELQSQVEGEPPPETRSPEERLRIAWSGGEVVEIPGTGYFVYRVAGMAKLAEAWRQLREDVRHGVVKMVGRLMTTASDHDARMADVEELDWLKLSSFSQFDVTTGGIRRQPHDSPDVMWERDPDSLNREISAMIEPESSYSERYLLVEVERAGLVKATCHRNDGRPRIIDRDWLTNRTKELRCEHADLSIGAAAESLVVELGDNPKTGKPFNKRGIEKIIGPLWKGGTNS